MAYIAAEIADDGTATLPARESEDDTIGRLDKIVQEAVGHPVNSNWRVYAEKAFRYREGDQIDKEMLAELDRRKQPPVIENRIRPQQKRFLKNYHKLRLRAAYTGRNAPMDDAQANAFNDLNRFVDQDSGFFEEEALAVTDHWVAGLGWIEKYTESMLDGHPRLRNRHVDPFVMWRDPFGRRRDLEDYRYLIRSKWVDLDEAIVRFPDKKEALVQCLTNTGNTEVKGILAPSWEQSNELLYTNEARRRLRIFEVWYRRRAIRVAGEKDDGLLIPMPLTGVAEARRLIRESGFEPVEQIVNQMYLGVFCGSVLIHHDLSPYHHGEFPFILYQYSLNKNGMAVGWLSEDLMTLQDAHNKRQSKALHLMNTNQVIMTDNAVADDVELAEELAKPDGIIKLAQSRKIEDVFQIRSNVEMAQGQLVMYAQNRAAFDEAGGVSQVEMGQAPGDVRSDRGLARLEGNSIGMDADVFNGVKASRRSGLLIQTANIQQFYTDDMIFQVTDDPETVRVVKLSQQALVGLRKFSVDLVLIEEADYSTTRQQQLELLINALPQFLQFGPGWADVLLSMTDLRDKDKLRAMIKAMAAPPKPEPKVSLTLSWSDMPINERVAWAIQLGLPKGLIQAMVQGRVPSKTEMLIESDQAKQDSKEQMEAARLELKAEELGIDDGQADDDRSLKAVIASVQEETKRLVATQQAKSKGGSDA